MFPVHFVSISDISNIPSTYFFGNPNVRPSHFAAAKSDVFSSSNSDSVTLITSKPFRGGGVYTKPTPSFLCLTSIECCNAKIFISLLHSKIFPSPKNSPTITNSLSNPEKVKYAILSDAICSIFFSFNRNRSLRNLFSNLFGSICSIFTDVNQTPDVDIIIKISGFSV